ncbi:hypothetical protein CIHG_02572 [Coccidioides immitis H538.4]|uniref:Uncharacterized protein n=1 Tax=Coccidioides immitis H538.4 TaxID=396776 RepID=A0A0J8UC56_COCIT|nr:hypothetical protein CIHG_02572 [Coccidioides immitis H538.4]
MDQGLKTFDTVCFCYHVYENMPIQPKQGSLDLPFRACMHRVTYGEPVPFMPDIKRPARTTASVSLSFHLSQRNLQWLATDELYILAKSRVQTSAFDSSVGVGLHPLSKQFATFATRDY